MKKLSQATEDKLLDVIEKTAAAVQAGSRPNDAIVKLARDFSLRPGEIELICRAYNTGRTNKQRETGSTLLEKVASFELADAVAVASQIYPSQVTKEAAVKPQPAVTPVANMFDYAVDPSELLRPAVKVKKAAAPKPKTLNDYKDTTVRLTKVGAAAEQIVNIVSQFHQDAIRTQNKQLAALEKIASCTVAPLGPTIDDVRPTAVALYGGVADILLKAAVDLCGAKTRHKNAEPRPVVVTSPIIAAVKEAKDATKEAKIALDRYDNTIRGIEMANYLSSIEIEEDDTTSLMPSLRVKKAATPTTYDAAKLFGITSLINWAHPGAGEQADPDQIKDKSKERVARNVSAIGDPLHEIKLKQIAAQANLQRLMTEDPYLRGVKPEAVADAFNQISQLVPNQATLDLPMREALRRHTSQEGLETVDQMQMLDLDSKLKV